jgi:hypothetical protein
VATNPRSWAFRDYVVEHRNLSGTPGRSLALVAMHRPLLSRYAPTQEKKPTREPTIASCRVAWCLISFRGPQQICGSNRLNATRWDSRRRHGTTEIALRIRRLQVRFLPSAPNVLFKGLPRVVAGATEPTLSCRASRGNRESPC